MRSEDVRFVWLFVFFDLPVGTKPDRRWATGFRKFLKDDGFMMLQLSVYARVCRGEDAAEKHTQRVTKNLLPKGSVRTLQVTDRQYARMKLLLGVASFSEKKSAAPPISSDFRLIHQAEIRGIPGVAPLATYHGEIGREATVPEHEPAADV